MRFSFNILIFFGFGLVLFQGGCHRNSGESKVHEKLPSYWVRVEAKQFSWEVTQAGPDGQLDTLDDISSVNRIVVPAGSRIVFQLSSMDVLHGFWIPGLGIRQTLVPGPTFTKEVAVVKLGTYKIACSELCGVGHAKMGGWLQVVSKADYEAWRSQNINKKISLNP